MSHLKKFTFLAAIGLIVAKISFAAIVDISKTQFSSNVNVKTMTSSPSSDGGNTSTISGVTCGAVTATTATGCNAALGISSGAIATACDGGLYTCTKPVATRAAAPVCDAGAKATAQECTNQGATAVECDEAGKYNCECPADYTKTCDGSGQYADPATVCINSKNEQLISSSSQCLVNCLTGVSGVTIYNTIGETTGCQGTVTKCYQTSSSNFKYQCDQSCSTMDKLYPQYQRTLNCATLNGVNTGMTCGVGVNLCKCSTTNYMENFDELASCANAGERPLTTNPCTAENPLKADKTCANGVDGEGFCLPGNKNPRLCGFPDCQPTDMNMMNQITCSGSSWYLAGTGTTPAYTALTNPSVNGYSLDVGCTVNGTTTNASLAGGTVFKYACSLTKFAGCSSSSVRFSRVNVCGCDNTTYKYVPTTTTYTAAEITAKGLTKCNAGEQVLVDNPLNKNFCTWDAQTSFAATDSDTTGSNAKVATIDENKIVYSKGCMKECATWETGTPAAVGGTCSNGKVLGSCAKPWQTYTILSKSVQLYTEYQYCTCPKDEDGNDLYKGSCPSGQYLGGKTCDSNGVTLYQYCLKPCDATGDRKYTDLSTADTTCGFPQGISGIDVDDQELIKNNAYACFATNKATEVSFQCRCPSNYYSNADCAADDGKIGTGTECKLDNVGGANNTKYQNCSKECVSEQQATLVDTKEGCNFKDSNLADTQNAVECYKDKTMYQCLCPSNYQSKLEHCGGSLSGSSTVCDTTCRSCMDATIGIGKACTFESKIGGTVDPDLYKYHQTLGWGESCSYLNSQANNLLTIKSSGCEFSNVGYCYNASQELQNICKCPDTYKTLDEFCADKDADCMTSYIGIGKACTLDVSGTGSSTQKVNKYASFGKKCPASSVRPVFANKESCTIGAVSGVYEECYDVGNNGETKFVCNCPDTFGRTCADTTQIRGGTACSFETIDPNQYKFEKCLPQCQNTATTPVVSNPESCPMVDGFQANTDEQCFNKLGDASSNYACRCPKGQNYQTLAEFCAAGATFDGITYTKEECLARVTGVGLACTYDKVGVSKYRNFSVVCPTNRPLFNSPNDCSSSSVPGEVDYYCYERNNPTQQKVVCKCPSSWVDISGNSGGANVCGATKEPSGQTCSFDGDKNIKYAQCYTRCDKITSNGKGISYLSEEDNSKLECTNLLGDGATLGVDGEGEGCSRNNTLLYPCYCGATYSEKCLNTDNEVPAPGALACTVGGTTYYESCANNACATESATTAIIDDTDTDKSADTLCQAAYGSGSAGKRCGEAKVECNCNARQFTETCEYPYSAPDLNSVTWCKYSTDGKLMSAGKPHFQLGQCKVKENLAQCGKFILNSDGTQNNSYTIKVAATENACKTTYGTGVSSQLCEYEDNANKRAYNCYYKASDFPWTESNCPVRHVLSTDYIISGGMKYYKSCDCHSAYKFHKYNCAGMLSGGVCDQAVGSKKAGDDTLSKLPDDTVLSFYPYCQCTADYNQVCDGERNVGVGEPCNGKYIACECKPDALPENWADNYYGCPGGKKPTGIIKPNGCGGKYYQCSVTQCTWQHTEKCASPLIGIDSCQDNEGNIGGYKSCKCPDGYVTCPTGTVGTGEPCLLSGKYYYKESNCVTEGKCVHGETQTCTGPLQIGVNPCTRNGVTYFEYCTCASGYNKKCNGDNEVGVGSYCTLNETKFYAQCTNPSMTCTPEHRIACDSNQTSYDPCINKDNKVMYKCKCPSNYSPCTETGPASGADSCKDTTLGTIYSACAVTNECTSAQNSSYKVCSEFQVGAGGSCVYTAADGTTTTKYAKCQETSECRANGYQYTCLGYDTSVQGDGCVDENGNKLYKECKCPQTWVECTGKNNTKGQSCVPLNSSGITGKTVYESCTCDASIYKYTCEQDKDAGNIGISGGTGKACTYTSEGKEITKYEACTCNAAYKYTCTGNGQVPDENDFCQATPGATKLYKKCECKAEFDKSCAYTATNPGMTKPQDANLSCTAQNPTDGNVSPRYSKCECGSLYTLGCNGLNQIGEDKSSCMDNDGNKKYKACSCDETTYKYNCVVSGNNKGITLPTTSSDKCSKQFYQNDILTQVDYYKSCSCQSAYKLSCDKAVDATKFSASSSYNLESDYCEIPKTVASEDGGLTDIKVRSYSQCLCKNNFKACEAGTKAPDITTLSDTQYCRNIDTAGTSTLLYADGVCQCVPVVPNSLQGWKIADGVTIDSKKTTLVYADFSGEVQTYLKRLFTKECLDERNGQLTSDGCGQVYYKCALDAAENYIYTDQNCPIAEKGWELRDAKSVTNGWHGTFSMYKTCDCPTKFSAANQYCPNVAARRYNTSPKGMCYKQGHDGNEGTWQKTDVSCSQICYKTLLSKSTCTTRAGAVVFSEDKCECNREFFNAPDYSWHNGSGSYWYNACVDSKGTAWQGFNRGQTAGDGTCP